MVFFTCNSCGSSLKKNQVEKHYLGKCRSCEFLTCVDCHVDFPGDTYKGHTKCITEDEKYGGKNYVVQEKKGEMKQQLWIQNLQTLVENRRNIDSDVSNLLKEVMKHENIPRKRKKFINFIKNISRKNSQPATIDKTWDLFEEALKKNQKKEKKTNDEENDEGEMCKYGVKKFKGTKNGIEKKSKKDRKKNGISEKKSDENGVEKEAKKRKRCEIEEEEEETEESISEPPVKRSNKFNWEEMIMTLLEKKGGELAIKKLKKKILAEYLSYHGEGFHKSPEEFSTKLEKKLRKNKKFKVKKDIVSLAK